MLIKLAIGRLRPDWFLWIKEHMLIQKEEEEKGIIESCDYKFFKKNSFRTLVLAISNLYTYRRKTIAVWLLNRENL